MGDKKSEFDASLVRNLADILNDTNLTEIEVEQGEMRVRVSREPAPQYFSHSAPSAPAPAAPAAPSSGPSASDQPAKAAPRTGEVHAPMVGTIYMSPAPGEAAFIAPGTQVREGQTLVIIEAMKVMNQIPSPRSGTVKEILVEDGEPVEYGQAIVVIE